MAANSLNKCKLNVPLFFSKKWLKVIFLFLSLSFYESSKFIFWEERILSCLCVL